MPLLVAITRQPVALTCTPVFRFPHAGLEGWLLSYRLSSTKLLKDFLAIWRSDFVPMKGVLLSTFILQAEVPL